MSIDRNPENRHWIQIEMNPEGNRTGAVQIDLSLVDKVNFTRAPEDSPYEVDKVVCVYAGTVKAIYLADKQADSFYQKWSEYVKIQQQDEKAKAEGVIVTAGVGILEGDRRQT